MKFYRKEILLKKENIDTESKYFSERLEKAEYWVQTYGKQYQIKLFAALKIYSSKC